MKTLLTLFVLFFSSSVVAEDISDFQIEGISVGDSALDHFSIDQIKSAKEDLYCNRSDKNTCNKFYSATFWGLEKFKTYDALRFHAKNKDQNHIIYSINGQIFYPNDLQGCLKQKDIILNDISEAVKNLEKVYEGTYDHGADKSGKTKVTQTDYLFSNGDQLLVACIKWSKEFGHPHTLHITFDKKEFDDFLAEIYE